MQNHPFSQFFSGARAELPILLGVAPFGMIYGILALGAGLSPLAAQAMSAIVFAGSAQFMLVQLVGAGTPALVMVLTGFVINLRHALYSASISPHTLGLNPVWKGILSYLLTDEAYAVAILHYNADSAPMNKHWYFFGAGLTLWTGWQISTAIGIFLGTQIPASWGLDFTLALTFIALVFPVIRDRPTVLAALAAGLTSILASDLPYKLGLLTAALVGILTGLLAERKA
ncbi:MAG: AzlC family ABC transporter permease [Anaerolineales bacterium]